MQQDIAVRSSVDDIPAVDTGVRVLRQPEVLKRIGIRAASTLWRWHRAGMFPAPIRIGPGSIGWLSSDIDAWLAARRDQPAIPAPAHAIAKRRERQPRQKPARGQARKRR